MSHLPPLLSLGGGRRGAACPVGLARGGCAAGLDGAVEYPHYTRPAEFRGWSVPDGLLSGDHAKIESWRREHVR